MDSEAAEGRPIVHVVLSDAALGENLRAAVTRLDCSVRLYPGAEAFLPGPSNGTPCCLVTDLELLEILRTRGRLPPVIVLTDRGDVRAAVKAMRAGASACVEKPYARQVLPREIRRLLTRSPTLPARCEPARR